MARDDLRVRFDLRTMFLFTTGLAIAAAVLFASSPIVSFSCLQFISVIIPAILVAGAVYATGNCRAFCVGGLTPSGVMLVVTTFALLDAFLSSRAFSFADERIDIYQILSVASWVSIGLTGMIAVVIRNKAGRRR